MSTRPSKATAPKTDNYKLSMSLSKIVAAGGESSTNSQLRMRQKDSGTVQVKDRVTTHYLYWTIYNCPSDTKPNEPKLNEALYNIFGGSLSRDFHAEGQNWSLSLSTKSAQCMTTVRYRSIANRSDCSLQVSVNHQTSSLWDSAVTELWIASKVSFIDGDLKSGRIIKILKPVDPDVCMGNIVKSIHIHTFPYDTIPDKVVNKVTLLVEISIIKGVGDTWHKIRVPSSTALADIDAAIDFSGDMKGRDVTLTASDPSVNSDDEEEEFHAHKFILAARSPVFAAMFEPRNSEMTENRENKVKIKDIQPEVLKEVLIFVYTGNAPNLKKMAAQLLYAAEKYQLKRLKALCERELAVTIAVNNAAERLLLAHQHEALQLKEVVLGFIAVNGRRVMKTAGWESVKSFGVDLVTEVLDTIYNSPEVGPPTKKRRT